MARSDIGVRVRAVGLDKSIVAQGRAGERVLASKPIKLKLDAKGFAMPLGRITGQMSEFQKSMDASAARVFAFGAAVGVINSVGTAFKALVRDSIELNKSLTELNSIFRLTTRNLQDFGGQLFDVARNTGQAFSDVTDAATEFSRQGLSAAETLNRLNDAMVLTRLSGLGATDSVKYLTAAINGFNKEALSSTDIVNRLANVDAGFAVSSRDLADAISRSGASAQAAKVEFNELLAIVTSVQQQTARGGAVIGNAFKTIFTRLQRSSVRNALEEIGVATEHANGSLRSATAILLDYARSYQTLTDQQRAYTAEQVAGVRQVNNLKALVTDMAGQYGIYSRALGTANSTTDQATKRNEAYNKTIAAMAHQTAMSVKEMSAAIGELTMGAGAERVLGMIQSVADFFNNVLDPKEGSRLAQGFMKGLGAYIAGPGLVLIGGAFLKLFSIMAKLGLDAVKSIFAVNTETQRRRALEEAILALLIKEENAMNKLQAAGVSQAQKEKIVLDLLRQQTSERQKQAAFLANLSGLPGLKGVGLSKQGHVVGTTKAGQATLRPRAEGHVPNFSQTAQATEVAMATGLGARGAQARTARDAGGSYVYNSKEVRVPHFALSEMGLNSKGRDMILPTYGRAKQENLKKLGGQLNVSAADAESMFMHEGFIPNFAPRSYTVSKGKGIVTGKQKGSHSLGSFNPNVGAVVSSSPQGMGHAFKARGRIGLSNANIKASLGPFPELPGGTYQGNYYADFGFPVGGLRKANFRTELRKHFKFEEFVSSLGFSSGKKPPMVHNNLEMAMDKVGRNQGLGRIFEAALLQGLRMTDLPDAGTWDIPDWQNVKGKYTLGLPANVKDVDVKYNLADSKGNKTMVTMFQKALATRPYMKNRIRRNIRNREGHAGFQRKKGKASGFVPNFAPIPWWTKASQNPGLSEAERQALFSDKRRLGNMVGDNRQLSKDMSARANAEDFRLAQSAHAQLTGNIAAATRSARLKSSQKEAQRIIFGITSPQTAAVITPTPGLRGMMKGKYNVPGFGPVNMGYRMFGYNKGGPAAKEMGGLDSAVRSWGKSKATSLSNLMTPGPHPFSRFASEGGITGATGSIFETAVNMALNLPGFKKETQSFDYPRGSVGAKSLQKKGGLFDVTGDWIDASVNPMDKDHMFKKIFNSIALGSKYFTKGKDGNYVATSRVSRDKISPTSTRGRFVGPGKSFTLADGFVPNFAAASLARLGGLGKSKFQIAELLKNSPFKHQQTRYGHWKNFPPDVKKRLEKWLLKQGMTQRALQGYGFLGKHGGSMARGATELFTADGFVPNFGPYEDIQLALNTERALTGAGALGYDPRVGLGVYDPIRQDSLSNAINRDHIGQGESITQAVRNSASAQSAMKEGMNTMMTSAAGFIPNFAASWSASQVQWARDQYMNMSEKQRTSAGLPASLKPTDKLPIQKILRHSKPAHLPPNPYPTRSAAKNAGGAAVRGAALTLGGGSGGGGSTGLGGTMTAAQIRKESLRQGGSGVVSGRRPSAPVYSGPTGGGSSGPQRVGGNFQPTNLGPAAPGNALGLGSHTPQSTGGAAGSEQRHKEKMLAAQQAKKDAADAKKEIRAQRMMMGSMGISMLAPMMAAQIDPQGDSAKGALKGGLSGLGMGALVPLMAGANPLTLTIAGMVAGFGALKGAIEQSAKSVAVLSKQYDDSTAILSQNLNAANAVVQAQSKLNQAYRDNDIKTQLKAFDEVKEALSRIIDPSLRKRILEAQGDLEKLGKVIGDSEKELRARTDVANVLKKSAENNQENTSFMGARGSIDDLGMGDLKWWAGLGEMAGSRIDKGILSDIGLEAGRGVELTLEQVKDAYTLLGRGTESQVKAVLSKHLKMTNSEIKDMFEQLDFGSGEIMDVVQAFLKGEQEMAIVSARLEARMQTINSVMGNLDGQIARAADSLEGQWELMSAGWTKMAKIVGSMRKSSLDRDMKIGAISKPAGAAELMRFQEDTLRTGAQVEVEGLLRDLLVESKDFKDKSLRAAYQDVIIRTENKPLEFLTKEVQAILMRYETVFQEENGHLVALSEKESEVLQELRKINVSTALSLLELRTSNAMQRLTEEGARLGNAQKPVTLEDLRRIRQDSTSLLTGTGRETIVSGAERGQRSKSLSANIENLLGVSMSELESNFFQKSGDLGSVFQMANNLNQLGDEIFGKDNPFGRQLDAQVPANLLTQGAQEQELLSRLFPTGMGFSGGLQDIPSVPAGMTIADFYKSGEGGVGSLKTLVESAIPQSFREKSAPGAMEATVEVLSKALLGMGRVNEMAQMSPAELRQHRLEGESNILESQLQLLIQEGKLRSKDIENIFGGRVSGSGEVKDLNERGLSIVKSIIKDIAAVKGPEFNILDDIRANTGATANLLAEVLNLRESKQRVNEVTERNKVTDEQVKKAREEIADQQANAGKELQKNLGRAQGRTKTVELFGLDEEGFGADADPSGRSQKGGKKGNFSKASGVRKPIPGSIGSLLDNPDLNDPSSPLFGLPLGTSTGGGMMGYLGGKGFRGSDYWESQASFMNEMALAGKPLFGQMNAKGKRAQHGDRDSGLFIPGGKGMGGTPDRQAFINPNLFLQEQLERGSGEGLELAQRIMDHYDYLSPMMGTNQLPGQSLFGPGVRPKGTAAEQADLTNKLGQVGIRRKGNQPGGAPMGSGNVQAYIGRALSKDGLGVTDLDFEKSIVSLRANKDISKVTDEEALDMRASLLNKIIDVQIRQGLAFAAGEATRRGGANLAPGETFGTGEFIKTAFGAIKPEEEYGDKGFKQRPMAVLPFMGVDGPGDYSGGSDGGAQSDLYSQVVRLSRERKRALREAQIARGENPDVDLAEEGSSDFALRVQNMGLLRTNEVPEMANIRDSITGMVDTINDQWSKLDPTLGGTSGISVPKLEGLDLEALNDLLVNLQGISMKLAQAPTIASVQDSKKLSEAEGGKTLDSLNERQRMLEGSLDTLNARIHKASPGADKTEMESQASKLTAELEAIPGQIERVKSSMDRNAQNLDKRRADFSEAIKDAAEVMINLPSNAQKINESLIEVVKIFKTLELKAKGLATGGANNAKGFIPNFGIDRNEARALRTEGRMGGPGSKPAISWSQKIAQVRGGDGRVAIDKTYQRDGDHALSQHLGAGQTVGQAIKLSAQAQGVSGAIPNFNYPLSDQIMGAMFTRLNIPQNQRRTGRHRLQNFLTRVGHMESDYDPSARAATTTASGVYQFTRGSSVTAINRMENLLTARNQTLPDWATNYRRGARGLAPTAQTSAVQRAANRRAYGTMAGGLSDDQARAMTLANFDQASGSDALLRAVINGTSRGRQLYTRIHHTNPDAATTRRLNTGGFFNATPTHGGLNRALGDPRRRRTTNAMGFIPNFATSADTAFRERVARAQGVSPGGVGLVNDLRVMKGFDEDIWRVFHLTTMGYPEEDIKVASGETWQGLPGPRMIYGKKTLAGRLKNRLKNPIKGATYDESSSRDRSYRAAYYSDRDTIVLGGLAHKSLSKGMRFPQHLGSLSNELTHFIQDNVLQEQGTEAPLAAYDVRGVANRRTSSDDERATFRRGFTDQELVLQQRNVEAMAWKYYQMGRSSDPHGSRNHRQELDEFIEWMHKTDSYGGKFPSKTYGSAMGRSESYLERLFKEIAKAHGDEFGEYAIKTHDPGGGVRKPKYNSLSEYHKAQKSPGTRGPEYRPFWMDNLGAVEQGSTAGGRHNYQRTFKETQSSLVHKISQRMVRPKAEGTFFQRLFSGNGIQEKISAGGDVWKTGEGVPQVGTQKGEALSGPLQTWRRRKDQMGGLWPDQPKPLMGPPAGPRIEGAPGNPFMLGTMNRQRRGLGNYAQGFLPNLASASDPYPFGTINYGALRNSTTESPEDFKARQKREKRAEKMRRKFVGPDGQPTGQHYKRRDKTGKVIGDSPELVGLSAFLAWNADEARIRNLRTYKTTPAFKAQKRFEDQTRRANAISSISSANQAMQEAGYSNKELQDLGIGYNILSQKKRNELKRERSKLSKKIAQQDASGDLPPRRMRLADETKLAELDLMLADVKGSRTPEQLKETELELARDIGTLYKLRKKAQGGRLGAYWEREYDVVTKNIQAIDDRRSGSVRRLNDKQVMRAAAGADGMYDILLNKGVNAEDANAIINGVPLNRLGSTQQDLIKSTLLEYGPPRLRAKDYASLMRGPQSNYGRMESSTRAALKSKQKNLFMDATRMESWLRQSVGFEGGVTDENFFSVYGDMDLATRARTKMALRTLTSDSIKDGISLGGTGFAELGGTVQERQQRTTEYGRLLELAEMKDDDTKAAFVKNLVKNDRLGTYLKQNPGSVEEVSDIIDRYNSDFVSIEQDANGNKIVNSRPGLENDLIKEFIFNRASGAVAAGTPIGHSMAGEEGMIDEQLRKDRKADYVKSLMRRGQLAAALVGPNGAAVKDYLETHPHRGSFGSSPALELLNSGNANQIVSGTNGTAMGVLSSLQDGTFFAKFMRLSGSQRMGMLDTVKNLNQYNNGQSLLQGNMRERVTSQILKDQGIELDFTGKPKLRRKDFESYDEFIGAKERRRDNFREEKLARFDAGLAARRERTQAPSTRRAPAQEQARMARQRRDAEIASRVERGLPPIPELANLAKGFIPNLSPSLLGGRPPKGRARGAPGLDNHAEGFIPNLASREDLERRKRKEVQEVLASRKMGKLDPATGEEAGSWDWRGYARYGVNGKQREMFGISHGPNAETQYGGWMERQKLFKPRSDGTLQLGPHAVKIIDANEYHLIGETPSGGRVKIPIRGSQAGERLKQEKATFDLKKQDEFAAAMDGRDRFMLEEKAGYTPKVARGLRALYERNEAGVREGSEIFQNGVPSGRRGKVYDQSMSLEDMENGFLNDPNYRAFIQDQLGFARGFIPNFSPRGQSAVVNEIMANNKVGQKGVRSRDVGFVRLNAGKGQGTTAGTMVKGGRHSESLVQTNVGDFVVPAKSQQADYTNRLRKQAQAAGMDGLPEAVMRHAPNAQGFIPNLQDTNIGISNVQEMQALVERFEGAASSIATTITEGSMEISHALNIEGKVAGLDQDQLIDSLGSAMSETASYQAQKQINSAFNDNNLNSEVAQPPTRTPRFNRPGNAE